MVHNNPYPLEKSVVADRQFEDVLKETYSRIDGLEFSLRESIATAIERFAKDPCDAVEWVVGGAIENQTTLSILTEIRWLINKSASIEAVRENFLAFTTRYQQLIIGYAQTGENCTSAMTNVASRATLTATARMFGPFDFAANIERAIISDIEETKKRVIVQEFVDLKVDDHFRVSPDTSALLYRKLSPRKAAECVYPVTRSTTHAFGPRERVYTFRVPTEADTLYETEAAA